MSASTASVQATDLQRTLGEVSTVPKLRCDIQALRGLAVLLVVLHHAKLVPLLQSGFLGVDIFFVISGYLVTKQIVEGVERGSFTALDFYRRRAKRLLPAAYVCLIFTTGASLLVLTYTQWDEYAWQQLGAVGMFSNFVLRTQSGYFDSAAQLKPLLNFWSLSLEEQYYMVLPLGLLLVSRAQWKWALGGATALSVFLAFFYAAEKPGAAFYLLPFRAWELGLGSLAALGAMRSLPRALISALLAPAWLTLVIIPALPTTTAHPGWGALAVCVATLIVIERSYKHCEQWVPIRALAKVGDISYSLYLIHWPLLALAASAWVTPMPFQVRLSLMLMAGLLAQLSFTYIEKPTRHAKWGRAAWSALIGSSIFLAAAPFAIVANWPWGQAGVYAAKLKGNTGFHPACESDASMQPRTECLRGGKPRILLWGDSHAMHLADALSASTTEGVVQATKSVCGPLLGLAVVDRNSSYNEQWARRCLAFNQSVLAYLAAEPAIHTVVLASLFSQYLGSNPLLIQKSEKNPPMLATGDTTDAQTEALQALHRTIDSVRSLGKRVVIVAPPPSAGAVDIGRCLELRATGRLQFGSDTWDCSFSEAAYKAHRKNVISFLRIAEQVEDVEVIDLSRYLCHEGRCRVQSGSVFYYRDAGHLSHEGSALLGYEMGLANLALRKAR